MMMSQELWNTLTRKAGFDLDADRCAKINGFLDLLLAANQRMNLTRITDRAQMELLHVADALTLLPHLPPDRHRLADIGSGGGIPGIILAIVRPDARVLLIESTQKKADFLSKTIVELSISNVSVIPNRAEDVAHSPQRETFDVVVARAVATLPFLVEWMLPLVKLGGHALAMKGQKAHEELPQSRRAIKLLGGGKPEILPVDDLPDRTGHVIVKIPKTTRTDPRYPRPPSAAKGLSL